MEYSYSCFYESIEQYLHIKFIMDIDQVITTYSRVADKQN